MEGVPTQKPSGDFAQLQRVQLEDLEPGKFYFMRVRNKDTAPNVWGFKKDYLVKINKKDSVGISAYTYYERSGDPRDGVPRWKKDETMILVPTDAIKKRNMDDNTTFYIAKHPTVTKPRNKKSIRNRFRKLLGLTRKKRST